MAARLSNTDTAVFLLEEQGMDPGVQGQYGRNAFLQACAYGNIKIVKYLAAKYPNLIDSTDGNNNNGLHLADRWYNGIYTVVYLIEELKMDPAVQGEYGRNAFLQACEFSGNIETVKFLADKYSKLINSVDDNNNNGLHLAVHSSHATQDIVVFLTKKLGMDPDHSGSGIQDFSGSP